MHKTNAGEKRKALLKKARELARDAKAVMKASKTLPEARDNARALECQAEQALAEADSLRDHARLEDLHIWQMERVKTTKKGIRSYSYWMATWREGDRVRNVHLGSCRKLDSEVAMRKAKMMKAEALGLSQIELPAYREPLE